MGSVDSSIHKQLAKESDLGRSPHGERGFKCPIIGEKGRVHLSLPAWGAWIQVSMSLPSEYPALVAPRMGSVDSSIPSIICVSVPTKSLPAWGAWIQVGMMDIRELNAVCRSPHGERGFKFEQWYRELMLCSRSPHGERGFKWFMRNTDSIFSRSLS